MGQWLRRVSQGYEMYCHDPDVVGSNLNRDEFMVCSPSDILSSQVVSLPCKSVIQEVTEVANFCAAMDTLIDQDVLLTASAFNKKSINAF